MKNINKISIKLARINELKAIKEGVENIFNLPDIGTKDSNNKYATARQTYYFIALKKTKNSKNAIAKYVNRSHASVINGEDRLPANLRWDEDFRYLFARAISHFDVKNEFEDLYVNTVIKPEKTPDYSQLKDQQKELIDMIIDIPEEHWNTVKMRLKPMISMLNY